MNKESVDDVPPFNGDLSYVMTYSAQIIYQLRKTCNSPLPLLLFLSCFLFNVLDPELVMVMLIVHNKGAK